MNRATFPVGTLLIFGLFLLVMLVTWLLIKPAAAPSELAGVLRPEYRLLAPFTLTDENQQTFDSKRLRGKWSMIFFGYLSCPDVCPMTLHELNSFWRLLVDKQAFDSDHLGEVFDVLAGQGLTENGVVRTSGVDPGGGRRLQIGPKLRRRGFVRRRDRDILPIRGSEPLQKADHQIPKPTAHDH